MKIYSFIKPNSKKGPLIERQPNGSFIIYIREIAAEGMANEAVIRLLAKYFNVSKSNVTVLKGHTSRYKLIEVKGI